METVNVISSSLKSIGYEGTTLEIEFHNGSRYRYYQVPLHVYQGFLNADSYGHFFNKYIVSSYRSRRISNLADNTK